MRTLIKTLGIFLILFVSRNIFAQSGWVDVSNPESYGNLRKIYFFSDNLALIKTDANYCLVSTNSGANWSREDLNFTPSSFNEYEYAASGVIFAIKGFNKVLLKSTNNGISYDTVNIATSETGNFTNLNFLNAQTGFVNKYDYGILYLTRTVNSGVTWDTVYRFFRNDFPPAVCYEYFGGFNLNAGGTAYATNVLSCTNGPGTSYSCRIKKSTNAGLTWENATAYKSSSSAYTSLVYSDSAWVYFQNSNKLLRYKSSSSIIDTITNSTGNYYFKNRKEGFYYSGSSFLKFTIDSGHTWYDIQGVINVSGINFLNATTGILITFDNKIYRTNDGGTSVTHVSLVVADKFSLSQNYPNPFNPSTKINYEIKSSGFVSVKVFDLLGKEVASLVNEKQNAGSYAVDFNSSEFNLPSGIYFYTLNAGEFKEARKMVLVK